jgi:hypothetical protein
MADVILPVPATVTTRREIRALQVTGTNDPDASPLRPDLKYGLEIHRCAEPQDDAGNRTGAREMLPPFRVPMADVLGRVFTRPDGSTFSGGQHLLDHNAVIDFYKGQDPPAPVEPPDPETPDAGA